ncbi:hypothetical protein [Bradyrhizobium sp. RDI18]|uniref:hypothetical protein n=1 Tax=Bradyrhizobium sp. RDI18 TaxID=3367400 RepID=UPI003719D6BC
MQNLSLPRRKHPPLPKQEAFADMIRNAGFSRVAYRQSDRRHRRDPRWLEDLIGHSMNYVFCPSA